MNGRSDLRQNGRKAISFHAAPSMTKQSFRDSTKVDRILKQYATKGVDANNVGLFQNNVATSAKFGVADMARDYQMQLNRVVAVKTYFESLPSRLRDFFRHEPSNMLEYMADPKNKDKCIEMGLFPTEVKEGEARKPEAANTANTPPPPPPSKP